MKKEATKVDSRRYVYTRETQIDQARRTLVRQMLGARTPEEIRAAWRAQEVWLDRHPHDALVLLAGEQLKILSARWYEDDQEPKESGGATKRREGSPKHEYLPNEDHFGH